MSTTELDHVNMDMKALKREDEMTRQKLAECEEYLEQLAAMTADARALAHAYNLLRASGIISYGRMIQVDAIARRVLTQNYPKKEKK